ncbi:MAG TPA: superoxide dismutase [Ni], partial [Acidimicrobiia bacterium]|nr:superoxide dismutase [Ni] [Acidimicrobiia bacterium]
MRQVTIAHAHCDLFCGVYDPAQAKIEAMSVLKAAQKYQASTDEVFRIRAIQIKEER